ncbi:MAG: hypothetical protein EXQ67_05375 [Thermoleophilia bacterium]|nr:hypothetical protein [Thermoleophilia bacterium]
MSANGRRGQASSEWVTIVVVAVALLTTLAATIVHTHAVETIANRLDGEATPPPASTLALDEALSGNAEALSLVGARAWIAESIGKEAAEHQLHAAIVTRLPERHSAWLADLTIRTLPSRSGTRRVIAHGTGEVETRLVTASDEARYTTRATTGTDRVVAAATLLGWDAIGAMARRIARPLGLTISAVHLLASLTPSEAPQPAGSRADDIVLCRPVAIVTAHGDHVSRLPLGRAWRIGVLRHDQLILDTIATTNAPCADPTSPSQPAGPVTDQG